MTVFVANTNILDLIGLKSAVEDAFINDADVTVTIKDTDGTEVTGASWPVTMDNVAGSDGDYRGVVVDGLGFTAGARYIAFIEVDAGPDRIGHWEFAFVPKTRTK